MFSRVLSRVAKPVAPLASRSMSSTAAAATNVKQFKIYRYNPDGTEEPKMVLFVCMCVCVCK
jgi:hypothetical protein